MLQTSESIQFIRSRLGAFCETLRQELCSLENILRLEEGKKKAWTEAKTWNSPEAWHSKTQHVSKVHSKIAVTRGKIWEEIRQQISTSQPETLTEFIQHLKQHSEFSNVANSLEIMRARIQNVLARLRIVNKQNKLILQDRMVIIQKMLDTLSGSPSELLDYGTQLPFQRNHNIQSKLSEPSIFLDTTI